MPERRVGMGRQAAASAVVAVAAFAAYHGTLLPGLDLGDTASFQDAGGSIEITPRQAYPLYFFLGNIVVWLAGGEPAHGMNLASAISGAVACGLLTWLAIDLTGSVVAGLVAGALFATSYTFWSQAVIAEVYALHVVMLSAALIALIAWGRRPASHGRLAAFFAIYALGFGNHLMMVLLAPAATIFLATTIPGGLRALVAPRVVALAVMCAVLGALQYAWNFQSLWTSPTPPPTVIEGLRTFWFDVTKSDWRRTMVLGVHEAALRPRLAMYAFDLRQQFGLAGIALALLGTGALLRASWRTGVLLVTAWLVAVVFAYTYNVGDAHVFFIPSHVVVALAAGAGAAVVLAGAQRIRGAGTVIAIVLLAYPAWRAYDTWPAVDRSGDRRAQALMADVADGLPPERALLVADLNWQLQNALDYYGRHVDPSLAFTRAGDRLLTLPWLIASNHDAGREIVLTSWSARLLRQAYGDAWTIEPERVVAPLAQRLAGLPSGTPYVLALLRPYNDLPFDLEEYREAARVLTGGAATAVPEDVYTIMSGVSGQAPVLTRSARRPFRARAVVGSLRLDIRMESWLPPDTMRRAGFGHVIVDRRHAFTLERGVSFVAFEPDGRVRLATYASGLYAPQPRYRIRPTPGA